ncbi:hypothetical protein [Kordia sp.]|uniref:hypothetical protein n=1 Tax=Kordia sp. TaxID=1965332 RepID=UPI003D2BA6D7
MKRRQFKNLELNKKAISTFNVVGGKAPHSHRCGQTDAHEPDEPDHVWFTDGDQHACKTF